MYDATIGRWISEDPLGIRGLTAEPVGRYTWFSRESAAEATSPSYQGLDGWHGPKQGNADDSNLYRYANNAPTNGTIRMANYAYCEIPEAGVSQPEHRCCRVVERRPQRLGLATQPAMII